MVLKRFDKFIYRSTERKKDGPDTDHATRKSHGHKHVDWVMDLGFIMCKKKHPNLYKIKLQKNTQMVFKTS
jgi:hypothetical protein